MHILYVYINVHYVCRYDDMMTTTTATATATMMIVMGSFNNVNAFFLELHYNFGGSHASDIIIHVLMGVSEA